MGANYSLRNWAITNLVPSDLASIEALLKKLVQRRELFGRCAELQAACLEILNLLSSLGCHEQVAKVTLSQDVTEQRGSSSALLDLHASLKVVYDTTASGDMNELIVGFLRMLHTDINTASRMLEMIPETWKSVENTTVRSALCDGLYLKACAVSSAPEIRTQALANLGSLMDDMLSRGDLEELPTSATLDRLWGQLQKGDINPALSCAIIETSGTIMAVFVSRDSDSIPDMEQRLRSWGDMLSECLDVDNVS